MTRRQLIQQIESILIRRREALRRSLSGELGQFRTSDESFVGDPLDAAVEGEYAEINSELAETEVRELGRIGRALERVREGHYGVCEGCGKKIPVARLRALPYATMCIECQAKSERGHGVPLDGDEPSGTDPIRDELDGPSRQSYDLVE